MENNVDVKFVNEKFIISLENGQTKVATPITRLQIEGTDTEYYYYSIDDDNDPDKVSILASRIVVEDENGKMNLSLKDINGAILLVSQFTLYADCSSGNRPSFTSAAKPDFANKLYEYIIEECKKQINNVETGIFGADMQVSLINDGPVTIVLEKNVK